MNLAKDTNGKDKPPLEIPYRISYYRRFQRNIWNIPFIGILLFFLSSLDALNSVQFRAVVILFLLISIAQSINTHRKWKEEQVEETT
jgi:hypothetical protein